MTKRTHAQRIGTGVRNLDDLLGGGLPTGSVTVLAGPPGSGKTILSQQIGFHNASRGERVLIFNTLSEPTAKTLRYLKEFAYFDQSKIDVAVRFVDIGAIARTEGLESASALIVEQVRKFKPSIVVIDSFKVFDDLASSVEELRKFGYQIAVQLMAWETTALLLGEYSATDVETNPLFSIVDGLISMTQEEQWHEQQRTLQIIKMRGVAHSTDRHPFVITREGIEIFAPGFTLRREPYGREAAPERLRTHVEGLDELLGPGIPAGSTLLVSGTAGTGKTALLLESLYRGALAGDKGILFSFEETDERLRAFARGFGWDLDGLVERGLLEIVFVPQPEIALERHLTMIHDRVQAVGARRIAIDSVSVFLHKVRDPQIGREAIFQLGTIVHNARAVGLLATDIPYGEIRISRLGVEETVVDGIILLTSVEEQLQRRRYIEVYKMRNTAHLGGRHALRIGPAGIGIFPRYSAEEAVEVPPPALEPSARLSSGVPGLDALLGGGLLARSATIVAGAAGTGKTTLGAQFVLAGAERDEPSLYVTLEEGTEQLRVSAAAMGLALGEAADRGAVEVIYLAPERIRPPELFALLTERITSRKVRRVVLDAVTDLPAGEGMHETLRSLLVRLIHRFKQLDVTTLLVVESRSTEGGDLSAAGLSPVADNLFTLRYAEVEGVLEPHLTIVKTRGSASVRATYPLKLGQGGARVESTVARNVKRPGRPRRKRAR